LVEWGGAFCGKQFENRGENNEIGCSVISIRSILLLFVSVLLVTRAEAQSNAPVRLAVIAETGDAAAAGDLLTAEFSNNPRVKLLERNEIEKVYREQSLSAANRDYLKLGEVLGADGLLLIKTIANTNPVASVPFASPPDPDIVIELIAVKPGVLLASERFFAVKDLSQWSAALATHLNPLLPKLSVLVQDAVPVSIVNLRAAMQSPEGQDLERQLTALIIDRLTRERPVFVLERRKMQSLTAEKELKGMDSSAFWNSSYLFDGTIDRNGYSKDRITISAELTPPRGGAPVPIGVSGNRTNLAEVINELAAKICDGLKLPRNATPWNAADEAQKYFDEAKWAFKWNLFPEAQSAAESAWALGKQDLDCALLRINACVREIPEVNPPNVRRFSQKQKVEFVSVEASPEPADAARALRVLQLYEALSRTLPTDEPKFGSPFYLLGLDALEKATGVLRHFHFHPEAQNLAEDKLADLRAMARAVAGWISHSSSVRDTYWPEGHLPDRDEIYHDFQDGYGRKWNFYQAELQGGCFWQDKPEDCCTLYRSLMESPLFVCIQNDLWFRDDESRGLVAWNADDKQRVPDVWQRFVADLGNSTNYFLRMEARIAEFTAAETRRRNANADWSRMPRYGQPGYRAMESVYAERDETMEAAWRNLFDFVFANYDEIVTGRESLLSVGLGLGGFFSHNGEVIPAADKLEEEFRKEDGLRLNALHDNYCNRFSERLKELSDGAAFERQKQYLAAFTPFNFDSFNKVFAKMDYSKNQALELRPLIQAYVSHIVANVSDPSKKSQVESAASWVRFVLARHVDEILNSKPGATTVAASASPPPVAARPVPVNPAAAPMEDATNALVAKMFLAFPKEQLPATNRQALVVFGERMRDDKLLLDLRYRDEWWEQTTNSSRQRTEFREAAAIWQAGKGWEVILFPQSEGEIGMDFIQGNVGAPGGRLFAELFEDALYVSSQDAIRKYSFKTRRWQELPFPGQNRAELFAVNKHLYAASPEGIWEILDGGQSARILASTRRSPAASLLDSRDTLGQPVLFSGPGDSVWVALNGEIFSWDGSDWKSVLTVANADLAEIHQATAFFRAGRVSHPVELWRLSPNDTKPVLCLREAQHGPIFNSPQSRPASEERTAAPLWKSSGGPGFARNPLAANGTSIYLITAPFQIRNSWTSETMMKSDPGFRLDLVCLVPGIPEPLTVPIRFDPAAGPVPVRGRSPGFNIWIDCSSKYLFIGAPNLAGVWAVPKADLQAELDRQIRNKRLENKN
jgi:hypothetical protein